jgi:hypothetical protein
MKKLLNRIKENWAFWFIVLIALALIGVVIHGIMNIPMCCDYF